LTHRKLHATDDWTLQPASPSLRERATAAYHEKNDQQAADEMPISPEEGLHVIRELKVHQIELEIQNEELRQSQLELEESRERYLDLYDRAPVGYSLVNAGGLIQEANCTLADMLGTTTRSLFRERFSKYIFGKDNAAFYQLRSRLVATSQPQTCELRLQRSDGSCTWVQLSASLAAGDAESAPHRVVLMDIDARVQAENAKDSLEAQLRESQKMEAMGRLAGGIAHDFNNILAVILSNSEMARSFSGQANPQLSHCVEEIQAASERARELVKQLLAFCRRQATNRKSIALAPVLTDCIRFLRSTIPARIDLSFTNAPAVPNVLADVMQIEQVVINLVNNAVQSMQGKPGSVRIHLDTAAGPAKPPNAGSHWRSTQDQFSTTQNPSELVRLTFSDNGVGMNAEVQERIFEPFFTTKPVGEGTGLGLAVVYGIIRAHQGEIVVESQPGQGSTFTIYFPPTAILESDYSSRQMLESVDDEKSSNTLMLGSQAATKCRILYLDDDEKVLQSIVYLLGHLGFQVHGYSDQGIALRAFRAAPTEFEIVVTDYNMPGLSGLDVAKQVREIRADLPVVVTSGFIDEELHDQADLVGVSALLPKPFSAKQFCELVQQLLTTESEPN
jgi:two-component system, cell cycle sensor histidine kinase and response regulator CckA